MVAIEVKSKTRKGVPAENALTKILEGRYFHRDDWLRIASGASIGFTDSLKELEKIESVLNDDINNYTQGIEQSRQALADLAILREKYERAVLLWNETIDNERSDNE